MDCGQQIVVEIIIYLEWDKNPFQAVSRVCVCV